ncbi:hypothetical protein K2Y11_16305 [bacterium]|nr:hypothetical protein [bacterium]
MLRALIWKEMREIWVIAAIGLAINYWIVLGAMGFPMGFSFSIPDSIPFGSNDSTIILVTMTSCLSAMILGWWQNYHEELRETRRFLFHRPINRQRIIAIKAFVGLSASLFIALIPSIHYALWAATPGTHPSPFYWWITKWYFIGLAAIPLLYLGGFLGGLFPNGPLNNSGGLSIIAGILSGLLVGMALENRMPETLFISIPTMVLLFVIGILHITKTRDIA